MSHVIDKAKEYMTDPDYRFRYNVSRGAYKRMSDEDYLKRYFQAKHGYELDLDNPESFSAKLQWLKLYDRNPAYTRMVDKYRVKKYVAKIIGEEYTVPTLGVWDYPEEIDFDGLPGRFVLKCTHDSHGLILCKDKETLDRKATVKTLKKALKNRYFYKFREWPYKRVRPRIIAEDFIGDPDMGLVDYKIHCFNGEPKVILVCDGRYRDEAMTEDFFDCEWNHLPVNRPGVPNAMPAMKKPEALEEMLSLARKLADNRYTGKIPFVRVDFYIVEGKVFFGEMTFYPASGLTRFEPESFDYEMGRWLILPERRSIGSF